MAIAIYISGHGFGHAIRQIEIINTLAGLDSSLPVVVRTSAPRWLFDRTAAACTFIQGEVDTGVVQRDSLTLDEAETIRRAAAFYRGIEARIADEAALLRRHDVRLVVADAPPLACAAAAAAGIPAVVCSNFTWDWIYADYVEWLSPAALLLATVRDAYGQADAGWRLPMHGGFATISPIVDVPFVARRRRPGQTREDIRRTLGFSPAERLALVSFGGYGLEGLPFGALDCTPPWHIVMTGNQQAPGFAHVLDERRIYSSGLRYQDVVGAVDVVISKPGYGIISDCIANGTAILYTSRGRFAEYDVLVAEMPKYLRCRFIDGRALREGRWRAALDAVTALPPPPEQPRVDGADVVARMILEGCDRIT